MQLAEREQEWQHQRRKDQSAHAEVEWQFQTKIEELKIQVEDLTSSLKRAEDSSEKANNMAADLANEMDKSKAIVAELKMELVSLQADAQEMSLQLVFDEDFSEVISREQEFKAQIVLQLEQLWQCNPGQIEVLSLHPVSAERRGKGSDAPVCEDQGKGCVQAMLILGSQMFAPGLTRVDAVANLRESSPLPCLSHTSINSPKRLVAEIEELRRQLAPAWEGVGAESMIDEDSQDDCAVAFRSSASSLADSIPSGGRSSVHATPLAESGPVHTNALMLSCNDPDVVAPVDTSASTPWIPALEVELARVQGERRSLEVEIQLADALASLEELRRERSEDEHIRVKIVELETQLAEARQVIHQLQQERSSTPSGSPQAGTPKELLEDHAWQQTADEVPVPEKMKPFLLSEPGALNAKDLGRLQSPQLTSELQYLHREELEKAESQFAELEAEVERQRTWMRDRETEMKKHLSEALDQQQLLRDMLASERARNESQSGTPCTVETQTQTEEDPSKQANNAEPGKEWGCENRCGFVGTFTEVEQHERTCAASNIKRFGIGNEQRRDQRIIAPKTAGPMPALLERTNSRESMRSHWSVLEECDSGDENKNRCGQPSAHAMTSQQRKWRCDWSCGFESTRFEDVAEHETVCPLAPEQVSALPTAQSYRRETASSQVSSTR